MEATLAASSAARRLDFAGSLLHHEADAAIRVFSAPLHVRRVPRLRARQRSQARARQRL